MLAWCPSLDLSIGNQRTDSVLVRVHWDIVLRDFALGGFVLFSNLCANDISMANGSSSIPGIMPAASTAVVLWYEPWSRCATWMENWFLVALLLLFERCQSMCWVILTWLPNRAKFFCSKYSMLMFHIHVGLTHSWW